jgi:hypothetical protein
MQPSSSRAGITTLNKLNGFPQVVGWGTDRFMSLADKEMFIWFFAE